MRGRPAGSAAWRAFRQCVDDVRELKGRRIAVGGPESGTRSLAATLLGATAADVGTDLLPLERDAAIEQLKKGEIDSVFLVADVPARDVDVVRRRILRRLVEEPAAWGRHRLRSGLAERLDASDRAG